jgi:hypothetical protein
MKATSTIELEQEPMGIVISGGSRREHVPVVLAYVWGPAPEISEETRDTIAA